MPMMPSESSGALGSPMMTDGSIGIVSSSSPAYSDAFQERQHPFGLPSYGQVLDVVHKCFDFATVEQREGRHSCSVDAIHQNAVQVIVG